MNISQKIYYLRKKYGITQATLAQIAGVSDKAISTWENGQKEPRLGAIQRICTHFRLDINSFVDEDADFGDLAFPAPLRDKGGFTGTRIRQSRLNKGYTLEEVARRIGVTRQTLQKYETGVIAAIPSDKIEAIANILNVPPAYLMGWENHSENQHGQRDDYMTLAERIKAARLAAGLTQEELAARCGTIKQTISKYERGVVSNLPLEKVIELASALGVSPGSLMGWDDESSLKTSSISPAHRALLDLADSASLVKMPIVGSIKAGYGGAAVEEETGEYELLPDDCLRGGEYFVLRVNGNSMRPELKDGDRVLCKRAPSVDSGSIAVVLYGEEATIKRVNYINGEDWLELIPTNPSYETKRIEGAELESCRVLGKVIQLIRRADALGIAAEQADMYEKAVNSPPDNEDELTARFMNLIRRLPDDKKEAIYLLLKDIQPKE